MRKHLRIVNTAVFAAIFALAGTVSVSAATTEQPLTKAELKSMVGKAETKADHERIAQYFDAEAARYDAEAKDHGELAPFYQKNPDPAISKHPGSARAFEHCDSLSKSLQKAAEEARQLAAEHRGMSGDAKSEAQPGHDEPLTRYATPVFRRGRGLRSSPRLCWALVLLS